MRVESLVFDTPQVFDFLIVDSDAAKYVPRDPEGTQVIVGSVNMEYISDTTRNRTHNLFRPKREPIPLCHSDGASPAVYYYYYY